MASPTPSDLRAEVARAQVKLYELAPVIGLHPTRLGAILNERLPLTPELAAKIQRAIQDVRGRAQ